MTSLCLHSITLASQNYSRAKMTRADRLLKRYLIRQPLSSSGTSHFRFSASPRRFARICSRLLLDLGLLRELAELEIRVSVKLSPLRLRGEIVVVVKSRQQSLSTCWTVGSVISCIRTRRRSLRACVRTEYGLPIRGRKVISHSETLNTGSAIITAGFRDVRRCGSGMKEDLKIIALAMCSISRTNCPSGPGSLFTSLLRNRIRVH